MKIVFIYRKSLSGGYSIEKIFKLVENYFKNQGHIVISYQLQKKFFSVFDVLRIRRYNADIYHITGHMNYMALFLPSKKTVLTIHDIGHYLYDLKGVKKIIFKYFWILFPIRFSKFTTVVSDNTKNNISKYLGISVKNLVVIENCYDPNLKFSSKVFNPKKVRILQVGTGKNKNILNLIDSLIGINVVLVLIGKLDRFILDKLKQNNICYENHVGISDSELYFQYLNCDLVTFISISEGFGMPIIEAQAMGRALITSNISPMSDVAGLFSCQVNPLDVNSIKDGLIKIIEDDTFRKAIITKGLENVNRFKTEKIANAYYELYKSMKIKF